MVDLATEGFDAGVRMGQFIAADMIAVQLTPPFRFIVVGTPGYLARRGLPKHPDDLRRHACLRLRRSTARSRSGRSTTTAAPSRLPSQAR
jgi:LysR substrate binding domain